MPPSKQSAILVVGAGVLGLATALGLLENGYEDVTVLDQQDLEASEYSPFRGADSASADTLKVIRSAYGGASLHHALATEAIAAWTAWNADAGRPLFVNCGWTRMSTAGGLPPADVATLATLAAAGQRNTQYRITDAAERARAQRDGWPSTKLDPFGHLGNRTDNSSTSSINSTSSHGLAVNVDGVLDSLAGYVRASDACTFALQKAKRLGAKFCLGPARGRVDAILYTAADSGNGQRATGVRTADGREHRSDVVVVAAGARTHALVPELAQSVTASGANIVHVDVPPRLQDRYRANVFPVFSWEYTGFDEDGGLSGFPLDDNGTLKFLYRSPKWTNPTPATASTSTPAVTSRPTAWAGSTKTNVPTSVVDTVKAFIAHNLPDLVGCNIRMAKLCWDSFAIDNDFVVDWAPARQNLLVVAGGSGHGFKFLPTLGKYVVKVFEGRPDQFTKLWQWRQPSQEEQAAFASFMLHPSRRLDQQPMATAEDLEWEEDGGGAKL